MTARFALAFWLLLLSALAFVTGIASARARLRENCTLDMQVDYFCTDYPGAYRGLFLFFLFALLATIVLAQKSRKKR